MKRALLRLVGWAALLLAVSTSFAAFAAWRALAPSIPGAQRTLVFRVERGASLARIAGDLERAGLVRSERAVRWWAIAHQLESQLRAGEFEISPGWPTPRILRHIAEGRVLTIQVVLPEGITAREIAARLEEQGLVSAADFLAAAMDPALASELGIDAPSLEGYLFPETYRLARGLTNREIVRTMVGEFEETWSSLATAAATSSLSRHQIVTLASIVEKETGAPDERPLIASVFLNRLKRGMRLETDPTVIYGIRDFDGNLKRRHLDDATNPYNTYQHAGLPPGPISNPGRAALAAVIQPAESDYLYFVSMNDGTHRFSRSYRDHVNAVRRYQQRH